MKAVESEYIKDLHFATASDFLKSISYGGDLYNILNKNFIYRGHYSDGYSLVPYALRENVWDSFNSPIPRSDDQLKLVSELEYVQILYEYDILQRFYNLCDINKLWVPQSVRMRNSVIKRYDIDSIFMHEEWLPEEFWELAALAQHYGLPTRLLDWSTNINTALYFAVHDYIKPLDVYKRLELQRALIVNKGKQVENCMEIWALDVRVVIAKENILPLRIIRPAYSGNPNLSAQEGLFTLWQIHKPVRLGDGLFAPDPVDRTPLDKLLTDRLSKGNEDTRPYMYHITIPQSAAVDIYSYLERINHTAAKLFPGYGGVAMSLKEEVGFKKKAEDKVDSYNKCTERTEGLSEG